MILYPTSVGHLPVTNKTLIETFGNTFLQALYAIMQSRFGNSFCCCKTIILRFINHGSFVGYSTVVVFGWHNYSTNVNVLQFVLRRQQTRNSIVVFFLDYEFMPHQKVITKKIRNFHRQHIVIHRNKIHRQFFHYNI